MSVSGYTLPRKELILYAAGVAAVSLPSGAVNALSFPVFNMALGVSPGWLGMVSSLALVWGAVLDPIMGYAGDRTSSKWGRRRPYLLFGGLSVAVVIACFFLFSEGWSQNALLAWYLVFSLLFFSVSAVFSVSYYALGIEIASGYDERTRVVAYRSFVDKTVAILHQWMFRFTELFSSSLAGARVLGVAIGLLGALAALATFFGVPERFSGDAARKAVVAKESLWHSVINVLANSVYRKLLLVWVILIVNIGLFANLGLYLNVYFVYGGDKAAGATLGGVVGTLGLVLSLAAIPITATLCRRLGKHKVLRLALALYMAGSVLKWFCVSPEHPWLQLVLPFFFSIGISSVFVVMSSMQADVVDLDEFEHGGRREGMFGAVGGWIMKLGGALTLALSGWVIEVTGFDVAHGAAQADGVFLKMRILFSLAPVLGCLVALFCLKGYPLTREKSEEIRKILEERRADVSAQ